MRLSMILRPTRTCNNRGITRFFEDRTTSCNPGKQAATNSLRAKSGQKCGQKSPTNRVLNGSDEMVRDGVGGGACARAEAEFVENVRDVAVHRVLAEHELGSDLGVG